MKRALVLLAAFVALASARADTVRTYRGTITGEVNGFAQSGVALVEVFGSPEAFAHPAGTSLTVRAKLEAGEGLLSVLVGKTSNPLKATIDAEPFRADVKWKDGAGRVAVDRSPSWDSITIAAAGSVVGIPLAVRDSKLAIVSVATNSAPAVTNKPPRAGPADDVNVEPFQVLSVRNRIDPSKAEVTATLSSARMYGRNVHLQFSGVDFPAQGDGKKVDGGVVIGWKGSSGWRGGFFDHHGKGQTVKTMSNIPGGYLSGEQPPPGAPVWFCLVNYAGTKRTNWKAGGNWKTFALPLGFKLPED